MYIAEDFNFYSIFCNSCVVNRNFKSKQSQNSISLTYLWYIIVLTMFSKMKNNRVHPNTEMGPGSDFIPNNVLNFHSNVREEGRNAADLYHRAAKYCLRHLTKLTELQRIVYGDLRGSKRIRNVERSLLNSKHLEIVAILKVLDKAVNDGTFNSRENRKDLMNRASLRISRAKSINTKIHTRFVTGMTDSLECIWAYKDLNIRVELLRSVPFDSSNSIHEEKLLELWEYLTRGEQLSGRVSRQWQNVGFQGSDPSTDFRGCGYLGLESMLFLAKNYKEVTYQLLSHSRHPTYSYPFAILSIQITFMAYKLFQQGLAKTHFYNRVGLIMELDQKEHSNDKVTWGEALLGIFFEFCCALIVEFDSYWFASRPKDIMEFGRIKQAFDKKIMKKLADDKTCFLVEVRTI